MRSVLRERSPYPPAPPSAVQMPQCPSVVMQQLHAVCKQGIRRLQTQASNHASNASRSSSLRGNNRNLPKPHMQQQQADAACAGSQPLQCQQQVRQLHPWFRSLRSRGTSSPQQPGTVLQPLGRLLQRQGAGDASTGLSSRLRYLSRPCLQHSRLGLMRYSRQQSGPIRTLHLQVSRAFSSNGSSAGGFAAAAARMPGRDAGTSSSWRPWLQQQLGSGSSRSWSVQLQHNRSSAAAAAGLAAFRAAAVAANNATAAAQLAAALRRAAGMSSSAFSARAAAAGWWDSWALWVDRTPGFLLSSLLNALNLAGNKLPMALGLLLVDMTHNSPLLGGSRADSLQQTYLPDRLPAFYANGAALAAGSDQKQRSQTSDPRSLISLVQGFWSEATEAASAGARLIWLGVIWLPAAVTAPVTLTWGIGRAWWLVLLRMSLEASGPAFIKWGQWAATRHDLFAQDVCAALEELHTNAPAHSFRYTCTQLKKSFSLPTSELFDWIEEVPIACGSIGQVHRGRLSETGAALTGCKAGELVAIKVRHPGVSEAIERDFQTMVWLARIAGQIIPAAKTLRLDETLKQFAAPLHEQVDLSREAANLQKFNKNFKRTRRVSFPLPLYPLVSPDVLVESFEPGRHISYYITATEGSHPYRSRLAELGSGTMLQMILVDNLIHSDLHPGNILVRLEPPRGFLGLAHKALTRLANPDGAAMRTVARALATLQEQQLKSDQPDQIDLKWDQIRSRGLDQALTNSKSGQDPDQSEKAADSGHAKFTKWYDVRQQWLMLRGAAADPAAAVGKLQDLLHEITASWLQPHLVLLDVGMATELSSEDQNNMIGLFRAFVGLDGSNVAKWTLRFSGSDQACPKPQEFIDDMEATFDTLKKTIAANEVAKARWKAAEKRQQRQQQLQQQQEEDDDDEDEPSSSWSNGSVVDSSSNVMVMPEQFDSGAEALATVLELVRLHSVSLPGHICAVVVTTLILEGWSNKLAPEHSVLNQVRGMFSPAMYNWHDRMDSVVDIVMDRGDTALLLT